MRSKIPLSFLLLSLILTSCHLFKKGQKEDMDSLNRKGQFVSVYENMQKERAYEWLSLSARIRIKSTKQNISVSATIKSRKDSLVWMRMTKLLEIVRAQVTEQDFQLINRLERTHSTYTYEDISTYIDPKEGIGALQSLLVGDIPFSLKDAEFSEAQLGYTLEVKDSISQTAFVSKENLKLLRYEIRSEKDSSQATVVFSEYMETEKGPYPKKIDVEIKGADLESISIEITKLEFPKNEQVDFEVPSNYKETK